MTTITELIGNTPMVRLQRLNKRGRVFIKLESRNPAGSIKDRPAFQMIKDLLEEKKIDASTMLIEPTSGNTGVALAMCCAALGLKITMTMPETMSEERKKLMRAYGATLVLTPGAQGMKGAIARAQEIHEQTPNSKIVGQFVNPSNPKAHVLTTAVELVRQCQQYDIKPSHFVCGVGTGGTVTGCSPQLKQAFPELKIVVFEPEQVKVLRGGEHKPHKIQGVSGGFVPEILNQKAYDEVVGVNQDEAYQMVRRLAAEEGILVGISSAAAILQGIKLADEFGGDVVCIAPDNGERYLSVDGLF